MGSESLWNYCKDEVNDDGNENNYAGKYKINSKKTTKSKALEYKTKITGRTPADNIRLHVDVVVPLKHLRNF